MIENPLDGDGYPSEEALEYIRSFDPRGNHICKLFNFIRSIWAYDLWHESVSRKGGVEYAMSTAGWSGNEDIIRALRENRWLCYDFCFVSEHRGGHFVFDTDTLSKLGD